MFTKYNIAFIGSGSREKAVSGKVIPMYISRCDFQ